MTATLKPKRTSAEKMQTIISEKPRVRELLELVEGVQNFESRPVTCAVIAKAGGVCQRTIESLLYRKCHRISNKHVMIFKKARKILIAEYEAMNKAKEDHQKTICSDGESHGQT